MTAAGHRAAIELGAALKAAEMDVERQLGANDIHALKVLLKAILRAMEPMHASGDVDEG